jgi:hypothetical protein
MKTHGLMAGLAVLASAMSIPAMAPPGGEVDPLTGGKLDRIEKRGKGQRNRRGKGAVSRPKARPNRLTIGKRVRRAHRRQGA